MNLLKTKARFLLPLAILSAAYGVSTLKPNIATKVPEVSAPVKPAIAEPVAEAVTTVVSQPPGKTQIILIVSAPKTDTVESAPAAVEPSKASEPAPKPSEPEPAPTEPEAAPNTVETVIDTLTALLPL